ncbi:MAG: ChbG/HpnK family deacetylase [Erysipelotrichaceae bacterium]|nr:ChbG/HpnK family deacetylase [Erysipelotrichaceae bacterium]
MKLLAQSDDYGITRAQALGCLDAIRHGIIRNTGMFTNMPWAAEVVEWIRPYLNDIAFGVDLNASTGPALLPKEEIPSLVHDDGTFLTSRENRALDTAENEYDHVVYEDLYKEFEAQIQKYIELVGKKPDYLHGHAYGTETTRQVSLDLAHKYGVPYSMTVIEQNGGRSQMSWYINPPTYENQVKSSLEDFLLEDKGGYLGKEFAALICHTGYVDKTIFELSSYNIYRAMDLAAVTSPKVLQWVKDNNIELITYKDVKLK